LGYTDLYEKIILNGYSGSVGFGVVKLIKLAQNRDRWRALVTAVMNLWVP